MNREAWKIYAGSLIIVAIVAFLGSLFTSNAVDTDWYRSIKPVITPPNYVFPIAWTVLFILIAVSLSLAWISSKKQDKKKIAYLFAINFGLNILWSAVYFGLRAPALAMLVLVLLWLSILSLIIVLKKINRSSALLLVPYLLWVAFAGILNYLSI